MARRLGPVCRLCRREGAKLFLKGTRCQTDKCAFDRRGHRPGQHGKARMKLSNYGLQLREKQKVKKIYGLLEKQFRLFFKRAEASKGVTGQKLLELLERRLDNVIFRLCFGTSRAQARQLVKHNHVYVNSKKVNIPSYIVKEKDEIRIKGSERSLKQAKDSIERVGERPVPEWLKADHQALTAKVLRPPRREEATIGIQEELIVELYSK
ncbi:MAG: 30S ribosomal protein S4 [Candidatus Omnitrophota bacterium]|nr:30S ribosomal protein S4 [Candidatus Omnitrophota bacterium]